MKCASTKEWKWFKKSKVIKSILIPHRKWMLSSRFPLLSRQKAHKHDREYCSPPLCQNKKPTDTTEEGIAPSIVSKTHTDTTERFPSRRVRAHINTTGGFLPPAVLPTDTTEQGFPSVASKIPHRRTERFPSPSCQSPHKYDGRISPPCHVTHRHNREGKTLLHCIKNPHRRTERFPSPLCQSPHEYDGEEKSPRPCWGMSPQTQQRRVSPSLASKTHTDATERFPSLSRQSPPKYDGEDFSPSALSKKEHIGEGETPLRCIENHADAKSPQRRGNLLVFLCWNM